MLPPPSRYGVIRAPPAPRHCMTPDAGAARRLEGQPGRALPACVGEYYFPTARAEFYSSSANPTAASATPGATPACVSFATTVALETMSIA